MSCYLALALPQQIILATDSLRRIWNTEGGGALSKPILLEDARKLHHISESCWVTGIGISGFHLVAAEAVKDFFAVSHRRQKLTLGEVQKAVQLREAFVEAHGLILCRLEEREHPRGENVPDPRSIPTDLLLAVLTWEGVPVLVRFSSGDGFLPHMLTGSGNFAHSSFSADGYHSSSSLDLRIGEYLRVALEQLSPLQPEAREKAADRLIPGLMAMIAKDRPGRVSASGDMVVINPAGARWSLF